MVASYVLVHNYRHCRTHSILKDGHIDVADMKGSWAGAMGQNQFMPTSFVAYAVDGDGDGKKDIVALFAQGSEGVYIFYQKENY